MAEVFTVLEVAVCITEVVGKLYHFISAAKDAKDDIRKLTQELLALKGTLEHFDAQHHQTKKNSESDVGLEHSLRWNGQQDDDDDQVRQMLKITWETLQAIEKKLGSNPKSKGFGRAMQRMAWPFRVGDVDKYLSTLERAKTWFIMVLVRDSAETTAAVFSETRALTAVLHEEVVTRNMERMARQTDDLLAWLCPVGPDEKFRESTKDRLAGSGRSTIVEELHVRCSSDQHLQRGLGFHYCSLDSAASQTLQNVFGAILAQMASVRPEILDHIRPMRQSGRSSLIAQNDLSEAQIQEVTTTALKSFDIFYILIDAMNETPFESLIMAMLLSICKLSPNLRVLITCTRDPIEAHETIHVMRMQNRSIDMDIQSYVEHRLALDVTLRVASPQIQSEIRKKIFLEADGSFRWAKLCLDRLSTLRTGREIRKALTDIPPTLNEAYANVLDRIPESDRAIARETLLWLAFSLKPLRLDELAEAVVFDQEYDDIDADDRLTNPSVLLDICQGLIHIVAQDKRRSSVCTLAHDSIRSFLESDWIKSSKASSFALDPDECHRKMTRKCVAYLRIRELVNGPVSRAPALKLRMQHYPLLKYASQHWPLHSERCGELTPADESLILDFFATKRLPNAGPFGAWVQLLLQSTNLDTILRTEPLYYAASFNMLSILRLLLRPGLGVDVNRAGGRFWSPPVYVAIWRGNYEAVEMLLRAGADPDAVDTSGYTSRGHARRHGLGDILELMDRVKPRGEKGRPMGCVGDAA